MNTLVPTNQVAPRFNLLNYERSAANKAAEQRAKIGVQSGPSNHLHLCPVGGLPRVCFLLFNEDRLTLPGPIQHKNDFVA